MSDVYISCWFLVLHPTYGEQNISKPIPEMRGKNFLTIGCAPKSPGTRDGKSAFYCIGLSDEHVLKLHAK